MNVKMRRRHVSAPHQDSGEKELAEVKQAIADGRLTVGGIRASRASDHEVAAAEAEADYMAKLRELGDRSIPVTVRMPSDLMLALRTAADQEGVRYQTLMKRWIRDRLTPQSRDRADLLKAKTDILVGTVAELVAAIEPQASYSTGEKLSERERRVWALVSGGLSTAAIAHSLHLSEHTVGIYVRQVLGKLGVRTAGERVDKAVAPVAAERRAVARTRARKATR